MRAFGGGDDAAPAASDEEDAPRRVVSLKKSRGSADDAPRKRARDGDDVANGDESGEARKKGVRGRGAATFQSSVVAAVDDGPRRDPPEAGPTRVLKIEGLKRPFTDKQLREALQGSEGKGRRDITWFWLNRNKSVCFAEFEHEREADAARTDLYDLTWPPTSFAPGRLNICFTTREVANRTVAEEPVGVVRDPVSARLGHIPGVAGLPGVGGIGGAGRGWGSLAEASAAARGGGGGRSVPVGARVGPIGGVAGFGIAGGVDAMRSTGGGYEARGGGGRGWGSLAAAPAAGSNPGRGIGGPMGDRQEARNSGRGSAGAYESPRYAAPVRLEDLFNKTKSKPEIFWTQNPPSVRERRLAQLRQAREARDGEGRPAPRKPAPSPPRRVDETMGRKGRR